MEMRVLRTLHDKISFVEIIKNNVYQTLQDPRYKNALHNLSNRLDATQVKESIFKKILDINNWYTRILGLDEVKRFQDRVVLFQEKLLTTQEKRREIWLQLGEIRKKSLEIHQQLESIKRQENPDKYLRLMKEDTDLFKLELEVETTLKEHDQMEREIFSAFSNAIRDSHEKQRAQMEYTKYFGVVLSITGSVVTFVFMGLRKYDLKLFIDHKLESVFGETSSIVNTAISENQRLANVIDENRRKLSEVLQALEFSSSEPEKTFASQNITILVMGAVIIGSFIMGKLL